MLIDWFTVGAQGINFVILVWLLKHFLYKPILSAIDAREKHIAGVLAEANSARAAAQKDRDDYQNKSRAFDLQHAAMLGKANEEAKAERERLIGDAHKEADSLREAQRAALKNDLASLGKEVAQKTSDEVVEIARKALTDLATVSLEERMGEVFTRRLRQMDGKAKEALGAALRTAPDPAIVRSAFAMPAEQRAAIQNALNEAFSADVKVKFDVTKGIFCGIELVANGQKIGWSIADYLNSFERKVGVLMAADNLSEGNAATKTEPPGAALAGSGAAVGGK